MKLIEQLKERFFTPIRPIPAGVYHYQAPPDASFPYRLHLRLETNGQGILIVNAKTVLHLNQTAAEYAYHLIQQTSIEEIARQISTRYRVRSEQVINDYQDLIERLMTLINTPDLDPVTFLDFERQDPYSASLSAPYRLDCALTYKMEPDVAESSAPQERVKRELKTEEWCTILDKAWDAGIPHIIFTGGEPTLRSDLFELLNHAQALGQVTGLLTDGLRLADKKYLKQLLQSGLDHLMIILRPDLEKTWQALKIIMPEDLFTTVHLTIEKEDLTTIEKTLARLADMGVNSLSLSVVDARLNPTLQAVRQSAANKGLSLVWDLPVPYSSLHPVALELSNGEKPPEGAGKAWLYVEPDGDVLIGQGLPRVLGNLLVDPWESIWSKIPN